MSLGCFYSGRRVERRKWANVWVGVKKTVVSKGMFLAHGGLFFLQSTKIHLKQEHRHLQGDTAKCFSLRSGIHKLTLQECHEWATKGIIAGSGYLAGGNSYKKIWASTLISLLSQNLHFSTLLFCLCRSFMPQSLIFKTVIHKHDCCQ